MQNKNFIIGHKRKLKAKKEYIQFLCVFSLEILFLTKILDNIITRRQCIEKKDQKFRNNYNEDILENNKDCNKIVLNTMQW